MTDVDSLLPPNATALEQLVEQSTAARIDGVDVTPTGELWNAQSCPSAFLPWLAWTVGVDSWNPNWPDATKRAVIEAAPTVHRQRGTAGAVKTAVAAFGADMVLQEWFETTPPGQPGTFSVVLTVTSDSGTEATQDFVEDVVAAINAAKNARSHFTFTQGLAASSQIGIYPYARAAVFARLSMVQAP